MAKRSARARPPSLLLDRRRSPPSRDCLPTIRIRCRRRGSRSRCRSADIASRDRSCRRRRCWRKLPSRAISRLSPPWAEISAAAACTSGFGEPYIGQPGKEHSHGDRYLSQKIHGAHYGCRSWVAGRTAVLWAHAAFAGIGEGEEEGSSKSVRCLYPCEARRQDFADCGEI